MFIREVFVKCEWKQGFGGNLRQYFSEMVSQHAMATTVRKVKQENRLRRQNLNQGT